MNIKATNNIKVSNKLSFLLSQVLVALDNEVGHIEFSINYQVSESVLAN